MRGADWLREQARVCHRLAVARGKYDGASAEQPVKDLGEEVIELSIAHAIGLTTGVKRYVHIELGDVLANALSFAVEVGIDPAQALADAQERNRRRAGEADQSGFCRSCGRPITDDGAYIKCFPCRVKREGE